MRHNGQTGFCQPCARALLRGDGPTDKRELVLFRDDRDRLSISKASRRNVKAAMLAKGTRGTIFRIGVDMAWPRPLGWNQACEWLRSITLEESA